MKQIKKTCTLVLSLFLTLAIFSGCGRTFDASAYLKAILDNSYKHDSTAFLEQKIGTKEEAEKLYQEGIQTNMDAMESSITLSDEVKPDFEDLFQKIYSKADYTVGESKKQEDDSYIVTVSYKPMNLFSESISIFETKVTDLTAEYSQAALDGEEVPDQQALENEIAVLYKDSILECMENMTYGDETTMDIRIELDDKVYLPNTDDLAKLENAILSADSLA